MLIKRSLKNTIIMIKIKKYYLKEIMQSGIFDFLQDIDKRTLKSKAFLMLKQNYIIKAIHEFSGEYILETQKKNQIEQEKNFSFLHQKELDRELEKRMKEITEIELHLGHNLSNTRNEFFRYMNSLNLSSEITEKHFPDVSPAKTTDLFFMYSRNSGGGRIVTEDQYEEEINLINNEYKNSNNQS